MQQEVFEVLAEAKCLEDLRRIEAKARDVYRRYMDELDAVDVKELAIHRRVDRRRTIQGDVPRRWLCRLT